MTSTLPRFSRPLALCLLLPWAPLRAEDASLRNLLRDALYTEEVNRDPDKAAQQYEELLSKLDEQRAFAATALFRLAEVRRKQGRKDEAIQLYQRLIREFPGAGPESKLAAENLAALGAKIPASGDLSSDEEMTELRRLQALAVSGPDVLSDSRIMEKAASNGWQKVVAYLIGLGQDPYKTDALQSAADAGFLNVCKGILDAKGPPPQVVADVALESAVRGKRVEILKLLLASKGFEPDRIHALSISVGVRGHDWSPEITSTLIKAGANLDAMPPATAVSTETRQLRGAPLHEALAAGNIPAANYLLDQGSKPDLATPDYNVSPLHYAVSSDDPEMLPIVKRLLAAGVDVNRQVLWHRDDGIAGWSRATPLEMAVVRENKAVVEALLAGKAGVNRKSLLEKAVTQSNLEILGLLLDAGLDPNAYTFPILYHPTEVPLINALISASRQLEGGNEDQIPLLTLLLDRGARPSNDLIRSRFSGVSPKYMELMLRRFVYPELSARPAITSILPRLNVSGRENELARKEGEASPPPLASFYVKLATLVNTVPSGISTLQSATIMRLQQDGAYLEIPVDFTKPELPPTLEWGDIVEFNGDQQASRSAEEVSWLYRRHLSASVSIAIGGEKKTYRMMGKRLVHDVTSTEVPWFDAGELVDLLWNTPFSKFDELPNAGITVSVTRKDWPTLRMAYPSAEASKFPLQDGDELSLELPPDMEARVKERRKLVVELCAPGFPYRTFFPPHIARDQTRPSAPSLPTLAQLLVEAYGGKDAINKQYVAGDESRALGNLLHSEQYWSFSVLPYPDLGQIAIRRLREDGTEETLTIDWSKAVAEVKADQPAGEFKKLDVVLQPGDIVELRVRKDRPAGDWRGFSPQEELLLSKMLEGKIQLVDSEGNISLLPLTYKAPIYLETIAGWLPLRPPAGSPSMKGRAVMSEGRISGSLQVTRDGEASPILSSDSVFLRDGDVVRVSSSQPVQPGQPGPRPRPIPIPRPGQ